MAKQSNSRLKKQQTPADVMRVSAKLLVIAIRGLGSIGARGGAGWWLYDGGKTIRVAISLYLPNSDDLRNILSDFKQLPDEEV